MKDTSNSDTPAPESETPALDACTKKEQAWLEHFFACGMNQTEASRRLGYKAPEQHGYRMSKNVRVKAAKEEHLAALRITAGEVLYRIRERARGNADDFLRFERVQEPTHIWVPADEAIERLRDEIKEETVVAARLGLEGEAMQAVDERIDELERRIVRLEVRKEIRPGLMVKVEGPLVERTRAAVDLERMREAGKLHLVKSVKEDKDGSVRVELYDAASADADLGKHLGMFGPKGTAEDPSHVRIILERADGSTL